MQLPQRTSTRLMVGIAVLGAAGAVIGWTWHNHNGHGVLLNTVPVKHGDLVTTISATGTIEPIEVVDVGAQVAGLIKAFGTDKSGKPVDYGSVVEEGTTLAKIDDSVYEADLSLARAQVEQDKAGELSAAASLEQLKAKLTQTEAEWRRAQELSQSKLLAAADFDSYKANYEIAKANVSAGEAAAEQARAATVQARALLEKAQRNLDFCVIKSPVKGVIIDRRVNIGQTVVASLNAPSLFLIAKDLTKMQIWVAVNEADVGRIVAGTPVTFTCDTFPGQEFSGSVGKVRLNATMTQNVVMYTVEVNIENPGNILLPYLTANVRFVVHSETNALLVPNAALRWTPSSLSQIAPESRSWKPDERAVTVWLKEGDFAKPVGVKAGATDGANTTLLNDPLHDGQEVVIGEVVETADSGTKIRSFRHFADVSSDEKFARHTPHGHARPAAKCHALDSDYSGHSNRSCRRYSDDGNRTRLVVFGRADHCQPGSQCHSDRSG